jgi:hypothetical protein
LPESGVPQEQEQQEWVVSGSQEDEGFGPRVHYAAVQCYAAPPTIRYGTARSSRSRCARAPSPPPSPSSVSGSGPQSGRESEAGGPQSARFSSNGPRSARSARSERSCIARAARSNARAAAMQLAPGCTAVSSTSRAPSGRPAVRRSKPRPPQDMSGSSRTSTWKSSGRSSSRTPASAPAERPIWRPGTDLTKAKQPGDDRNSMVTIFRAVRNSVAHFPGLKAKQPGDDRNSMVPIFRAVRNSVAHLPGLKRTPPTEHGRESTRASKESTRFSRWLPEGLTSGSARRRGVTAAQQKVNDLFLHDWISKIEDKLELLETMVFSLLLTSSWKVCNTIGPNGPTPPPCEHMRSAPR